MGDSDPFLIKRGYKTDNRWKGLIIQMEMMKDTEQRGSHRDRFGAFVKSAFSYPRKLWGMRPVTAVSIVISTMLFAILDFIDADILFHIALAVLYFAIFALCLESIRIQKRQSGSLT